MEDRVKLDVCYGPLVRGEVYRVAARGSDWVLVKADGKAVYVPKDITRRVYDDEPSREKSGNKTVKNHGFVPSAQEEFIQRPRRRDHNRKQRETA